VKRTSRRNFAGKKKGKKGHNQRRGAGKQGGELLPNEKPCQGKGVGTASKKIRMGDKLGRKERMKLITQKRSAHESEGVGCLAGEEIGKS